MQQSNDSRGGRASSGLLSFYPPTSQSYVETKTSRTTLRAKLNLEKNVKLNPDQEFVKLNPDQEFFTLLKAISDRDAAISEKNLALVEKKAAIAERDAALLQRNVAYADRDSIYLDRDRAVAALKFATANREACSRCSWGRKTVGGVECLKNPQPISMMDSSNREEGVHRLALAMVSEGVDLVKTESLNKSKKRKKCKEGQKEVQPKKKALPTENQTIKPSNAFAKTSQASVTGAQKSDEKPKPKLAALQDSPKLLQSFVNGVLYNSKTTPIPYCSCTGVNQKCYRWGNGGWQSACCTNVISMYPLPMSPKKKGCRVPGRKMSAGAFERLLERLFLSGTNVSMAVDLKDHWAKHGTNRYVTIK